MIIVKKIFQDIVESLTVNNTSVNYKFGYWPTIAKELQDEGRAKIIERYPLILLHADFSEQIVDFRTIRISPTFYIITQTEVNYNIDRRLELVYIPVLYKIYVDFIKAIKNSHKFWYSGGEISHTKTDMYYLQNIASNQNKINAIVDAIELKFDKLDLIKSVYDNYEYITE